jgi:hypothetical protein
VHVVSIKAKVRDGRLVVDEATDLPEGTEVELVAVMEHGEDALRSSDREALHRSLGRAAEDIAQGRLIDGDEVLERLKARDG